MLLRNKKILILIISLFFFLVIISDIYNRKIRLTQGQYERGSTYYMASFETETASVQGSDFAIEKDIIVDYCKKEIVRDLANTSRMISLKIKNLKYKSINVYIVSDKRLEHPYIENENVFIPLRYYEDGTYKYYLVQTQLGLCQGIKSYGVYCYLFGDKLPNSEKINIKTCKNLFVLKQCDVLFSDNEIANYNCIIQSLSLYLIDKKGVESFVTDEIKSDDVRAWADFVGVNILEQEKAERVTKVQLAYDENGQVILKSEDNTFVLTNDILTKEDYDHLVELVIWEAKVKLELKSYFSELEISGFEIAGNVNEILYVLSNDRGYSNINIDDSGKVTINLRGIAEDRLTHELVHAFITPKKTKHTKLCIEEGICTYLAEIEFVLPQDATTIERFGADKNFSGEEYVDYYKSHKSEGISAYYSFLIKCKYNGRDVSAYPVFASKINVGGTSSLGDELSYIECMSFVNYLAREYGGMKNVLEFLYTDISYEDYFGKNYYLLKKDWINSVQ